MKGAVLALFCAVALVSAELNENGCPINPYVDVLKPHPNCNKFYQCLQGDLIERKCASDLVFNVEIQECDWPQNVDCGNKPIVPDSSEEASNDSNNSADSASSADNNSSSDSSSREDSSNSSSNESGNQDGDSDNGGGNDNSNEAANICAAEGSDGVLLAHENCNQFYKCSGGVPVAFECQLNLLYNPENEQCDWPENVDCENRDSGNGSNGNGDNVDSGNGDSGNGDSDNDDSDNNGDNGNNGGGNGNPSEAPEICAAEGSDGVLVAHENCHRFYKCSEGVPVALDCPPNLLFNPVNDQCDWPENVNCENRDTGNGGNGNGDNEDSGNGDSDNGEGDNNGGNEDDDNDNGNNGGGNDNPSEAPEICAAEGSDGVLVAHENCNQFYKCSEGVPAVFDCQLNLLFNPVNDQCDWPENVVCERNSDSGNGDGDSDSGNQGGGGNSDPSQAAEICAAEDSDSVLVAHENCNQYYVCRDGLPVARDCPPVLNFNPATDSCDWSDNVDCGTRRTFTSSINKHLRFRM